MSELIDNRQNRINTMKSLMRQLHEGTANGEQVQHQLEALLEEADYSDVFLMEIQLIEEGIEQKEIQRLCDIHTKVLRKHLDKQEAPDTVPGHPVHTFRQENEAIEKALQTLESLFDQIRKMDSDADATTVFHIIHAHFNSLMDVDKHYRRKENMLFPFFEKKDISGPPAVMWGKHDEARQMLKDSIIGLSEAKPITAGEGAAFIKLGLIPTIEQIREMIYKEEKILLPMSVELLTDSEWYEIYLQSDEVGYCLYFPQEKWEPEDLEKMSPPQMTSQSGRIKLPTGSISVEELTYLFNTMPVDITFVDKDDVVRYYSHGKERIFDRNRAILGRKVQFCHPPSSVHVVEQIVTDFKSGEQDVASFWINLGEKFVLINYYAVRDDEESYLGTLEVTQDITDIKKLEGERRILSYEPVTAEA